MRAGRCVYCGHPGALTCLRHRDLLPLDRAWWETRGLRRYWLDRYSDAEILVLARSLGEPRRDLVRA